MRLRETHVVFFYFFGQTNISSQQGCVDIRAVAHCSHILIFIFLSIYFSLFLTCWSSRGWCCIILPLHGCRTCPAIRRWDCRPIASSYAIRASISHQQLWPCLTWLESLSYMLWHYRTVASTDFHLTDWPVTRGAEVEEVLFQGPCILAVKLSHQLLCSAQQASCCLCDFFLQYVPLGPRASEQGQQTWPLIWA